MRTKRRLRKCAVLVVTIVIIWIVTMMRTDSWHQFTTNKSGTTGLAHGIIIYTKGNSKAENNSTAVKNVDSISSHNNGTEQIEDNITTVNNGNFKGCNDNKEDDNQHNAQQSKSNSSMPLRKLYSMLGGRLGNQLFRLAALYGLSRTNHRQLVMHPKLLESMQSLLNISFLKFPIAVPPPGVRYIFVPTGIYQPIMEKLPDEDLQIGPFFTVSRYFLPYASEVRKMMVVRDDLVVDTQRFLHGLPGVSATSTLVGVHVRRGDRASKRFKEKVGDIAPGPDYLRNAMTHFLQKYQDVHFIVCSDEMAWVKHNEPYLQTNALLDVLQRNYSVHFRPASTSGSWDLALLAQCNHTIYTIGSYGWWAAWLAGGETIFFNHPVRAGSFLAGIFKIEQSVWPTWIGMGDNVNRTD